MYKIHASSKSNPSKLARAIVQHVVNHNVVGVQAIGAASINQVVKGITIAREFFAPGHHDLNFTTDFTTVPIEGQEKDFVAIHFTVRKVQKQHEQQSN